MSQGLQERPYLEKGEIPKVPKEGYKEMFPLKDDMDSKDSVLGIKEILVSKRKEILGIAASQQRAQCRPDVMAILLID